MIDLIKITLENREPKDKFIIVNDIFYPVKSLKAFFSTFKVKQGYILVAEQNNTALIIKYSSNKSSGVLVFKGEISVVK